VITYGTERKMEEAKKKKSTGGRPAKKVKREFLMGFNATAVEKTVIQEKAKRAGLRVADYLRDLAMRGKVRSKASLEEVKLYRDLTGAVNNLNQLVKEAHKQNLPSLIPKVLKTLDELTKLKKSLDHIN